MGPKKPHLNGLLHHSTKLIALNNGFALGALSEEGLESSNKHVSSYVEILARGTSVTDQLKDVMHLLLARSNPIRLLNRKMIKKIICPECGPNKHSIRSHHRAVAWPNVKYDTKVDELLYL